MIRRFEAIGVLLLVALSLIAALAPSAGAIKFSASSYPATLTAESAKGNDALTTEGGKVECNTHLSGTLSGESETASLTPTYTECSAFGFVSATVKTTGCTYVLHANGEIDLECTTGNKVVITASTCEVQVSSQTGLKSVHLTNGAGNLSAKASVSGIAYTVTKDGFLCPFSGTGAKTGATYTQANAVVFNAISVVPTPVTFKPEESFGGKNPSAPEVEGCYTGAPVNCASGNQTEEQVDIAIGGRGPALRIARSYNSQAAYEAKEAGPWGYGWSGPYGAHLSVSGEVATVYQDNGSTVSFGVAGGTYTPGGWVQATLKKEGENYLYTLPNREKLKFNSSGQLIEQTDRNGNALTFTYSEGKLSKVKDAAGRELVFAYSGSQVKSVEDPMGNKVTYTYESGNLATVTLPGKETARWKFKYDGSHQLTEMTNGRGYTTKTEYDASHRVKAQSDPLERETKFSYGETEGIRETTITEPNGSTTFEKFNKAGEPLEVVRDKGTALQQTTKYEYNANYLLVKKTDPLSHVTTYEYDGEGNRTLEKDPEGNETKWTYNSAHEVKTTTTPRGETTTINRDKNGNVESIERPAPESTTQKATFKYAANGDLESETDPLGHETKFEYDTYGDRKAVTDPEGNKTTWTYDKNGLAITEVSPRGNEEGAEAAKFTTSTERDAQGRPIVVTDPLGHETKYAYDGNGNVETLTDAKGNATKYTYDAADQRTKVEAGNGTTSETAYDSMGAVKGKTDGNGKTTEYKRNALGQLTETIDPLERKTTREYDAAGNLEKLNDPEGRTTTYSYDKADRLTKINYSEEATPDVEYEYDKDGNVTAMKDGTGTTKKVYDQLGRLTETENGNKEVVKYEYDLASRTTKITYPNGKSVSREYDKADRMTKVTDWLSRSTTFSYDRNSMLKATAFPAETGNEDTAEYNAADELTKQTFKKGAETLASISYARDKLGQVESTTQAGLPGKETIAYEYDKANRLTKAGETSFEYDNAGNPTKIGTGTYKYDKASQLESGGGVSYTFDKLGQRTKATPESGPATTYGYDQAGNLVSASRSAEGEVPKIEDAYAYDGSGLRASQKISGTTKQLSWDVTGPLPLLLYDGTNYYLYGPDGLPFEQIASETPTYLHHDQQGSARLLTNSTGEAKGTYTYTAYGAVEGHTGTAATPLGYGGQLRNDSTGLIYLRARTYDPVTAQFMSVDPIVMETAETYGYADANPVNRGDPGGLDPGKTCGCTLSAGSWLPPWLTGTQKAAYLAALNEFTAVEKQLLANIAQIQKLKNDPAFKTGWLNDKYLDLIGKDMELSSKLLDLNAILAINGPKCKVPNSPFMGALPEPVGPIQPTPSPWPELPGGPDPPKPPGS